MKKPFRYFNSSPEVIRLAVICISAIRCRCARSKTFCPSAVSISVTKPCGSGGTGSVLLENYYLPGDLEASIGAFVGHYNHRRYHESLGNLTPADVYFGRDHAIIERRRKIKEMTIRKRRLAHQQQAA